MKGKFITFEGIEGCGKTTQTKLLSDYLKTKSFNVSLYREPGATRVGEMIRKILLNPDHVELCPYTELLLYYAARAQIVEEKIMPVVGSGGVVLCDRFYDSSIAYQHYGRGLNIKLLDVLTDNFVKVKPDLTILLDIPVEVGLARKVRSTEEFGKLDRMESQEYQFHQRVREGYLEMAEGEPGRIKVFDGTLPIESISEKINFYVFSMLKTSEK